MRCSLRLSCFALALAAWAANASDARADGMRFWQEGDTLLSERSGWRTGASWKLVSADASARLDGWEVKPRVQRIFRPGLEATATYKFARGRGADDTWSTAHTLELDLANSWALGTHTLQLTQRLGMQNPATGGVLYRYHSIPRIEWGTQWLPVRWTADSVFESVYDFQRSGWIETKLTPLRLRYLTDAAGAWSLAYLLNHKLGASDAWHRDHVVVLAVAFDLRDE